MAQETLCEGIFRSLATNKRSTLLIIALSVVITAVLHQYFPTVYEAHSLLRVLSTESPPPNSLAASMNGILSQKDILAEALKKEGLEQTIPVTPDLFSFEDAGPGLVKMIIRHANPGIMQNFGDILIKTLSEKYLSFSSEADGFEIEACEMKKNTILEKIKEARAELDKQKTNSAVSSLNLPGDEDLQQVEYKLEEGKQRLAITPKIRVVATKEQTILYRETKGRLSAARARLSELLSNYRERHPRVIKANVEIAEIETTLRSISSKKDKEEPNPEYEVIQKEVGDLETQLVALKSGHETQQKTALEMQYGSQSGTKYLDYRIAALEKLYNEVIERLEHLSVKRLASVGKIQVLKKDRETPGTLGLSFLQREFFGFLSGAILAVILLYTPTSGAEAAEKLILSNAALMSLGANKIENEIDTMRRVLRIPMSTRASLALPGPTEVSYTKYDERLIVLNEPESRLLEPLRQLLANLQIQLSETGTRVLMVSSSRNGQGRTTLVANLAILFAQEGYSVVLVDANFRKPALHRVFELENHAGLTNLLQGQAKLEVIQPTSIRNLTLIPSGPIPQNPYELLGSMTMKSVLDNLKRRFELVLIDTPGLLDFSDARILAEHTGGVVFLHRLGEPDNDIRSSREFLQSLKTRVLGFVQT